MLDTVFIGHWIFYRFELLANFDETKKQYTGPPENSSVYDSLVDEIRQGDAAALTKMARWLRFADSSLA